MNERTWGEVVFCSEVSRNDDEFTIAAAKSTPSFLVAWLGSFLSPSVALLFVCCCDATCRWSCVAAGSDLPSSEGKR
eukprot:scaffold609_cov170-Amphora_coffeaeformis.AAC.36